MATYGIYGGLRLALWISSIFDWQQNDVLLLTTICSWFYTHPTLSLQIYFLSHDQLQTSEQYRIFPRQWFLIRSSLHSEAEQNSWLWKMTIVLYTTKRHFLHEYNLTLWLLRNNLFKCIFNIFLLIHSFIPFFTLRTYFQLFLYPLHCLHWLHFTLHHFCKYLTIYITSWAFRREIKDKWMKKRVLGEISYSGNKKKEKRFIHNNFWLVAF